MRGHRVVDHRLDAVVREVLSQLIAVPTAHYVEVIDVADLRSGVGQDQSFHTLQLFPIPPRRPAPFFDPPAEVLQLDGENTCLNLVHARVDANHLVEILATGTVIAHRSHVICKRAVVGSHGAGIAQGPEYLRGVEAGSVDAAEAARRPAPALGPLRLCVVLDNEEAVAIGDLRDRLHIAGLSKHVHRQDCPGARGDGLFDGCGIYIEGVRVWIDRNYCGLSAGDREPGRDVSIRRYDDLVALADVQGLQGQVHRIEPVCHSNAMSGAAEASVGLLESPDFLPEDETPRIVEGLEVAEDLIPQPLVNFIQRKERHPRHEAPVSGSPFGGSPFSASRMTNPGRPLTSSWMRQMYSATIPMLRRISPLNIVITTMLVAHP